MVSRIYKHLLQATTLVSALALSGCARIDNADLKYRYDRAETRCAPVDTIFFNAPYRAQFFAEFLDRGGFVLGDACRYGCDTFDVALDRNALRHRSTGERATSAEIGQIISTLCPQQPSTDRD